MYHCIRSSGAYYKLTTFYSFHLLWCSITKRTPLIFIIPTPTNTPHFRDFFKGNIIYPNPFRNSSLHYLHTYRYPLKSLLLMPFPWHHLKWLSMGLVCILAATPIYHSCNVFFVWMHLECTSWMLWFCDDYHNFTLFLTILAVGNPVNMGQPSSGYQVSSGLSCSEGA